MHSNKKSRESPAAPWYSDGRYSVFWQHYNTLMRVAHQDALVRARHVGDHTKVKLTTTMQRLWHCHINESPDTLPPLVYSQLPYPTSNHSSKLYDSRSRYKRQKKQRKMKRSRMRKEVFQSNQGNQSDTESLHSKMSQGMHIQDTSEDMEVTEDFLLFLEQSKKHREEWKMLKTQQKTCSEPETTMNQASITDTRNKEHPDVVRSREMQQLYGQASAKLQAMETALQLSFDRNATLHQPQYWPNIPLNVIFN